MENTQAYIHSLVESQRLFFAGGTTQSPAWRVEQLKKLKQAVIKYSKELEAALGSDLGRSPAEAYFCDIGAAIMEINEYIKGTRRWARPDKRFSGMVCFPSIITKVYKMPYGVTLIISPFNFPVLLSLGVLAASVSGGNTAVIKASSKSAASTAVLKRMLQETFPSDYITLVDGGHETADYCLTERFDKIFYTGSPKIGMHIMQMASRHLTPVALELGGETGNWCIIRKDADIKDAARKIAFLKLCNSGQICININQIAAAEEIADRFVHELQEEFRRQIGDDPLNNPEYPRMISFQAYDRCADEAKLYSDRIIFGGTGERTTCRYAPTIIYPVSIDEPIVQHELFCPLLPVVPFKDNEIGDLMKIIASREHGLALYIFSKDKKWAEKTMRTQQFGGGCINEVCMHLMVNGVPFNGTGHSGMGAYHGKYGFMEFTHPQTVLFGKTRGNLPLREHPYSGTKNKYKLKLIRFFER